jgi:hypothetical protein
LADAAVYGQEHDVVPALSDRFAASRANDVKTLIACMDRRRRYGPALAEAELDELAALLGKRPASRAEGLAALDAAISEHRFEDDVLIRTLARKAYREEWLHAPAAELYPERRWAALDG